VEAGRSADGACLGIPAMTAYHHCLFADGPVAGKTVLVTGAAGGLGQYAVQLAKWGGATVIATVSSAEKAAQARAIGADHVVSYRDEDVTARVLELTDGAGIDRVVEVEFGANLPTSLQLLKTNGVIATYASDADMMPARTNAPQLASAIRPKPPRSKERSPPTLMRASMRSQRVRSGHAS